MKKINKEQGFGLFFVGLSTMVVVISSNMPKTFGLIMIGMAILLFISGIFIFFKYRK